MAMEKVAYKISPYDIQQRIQDAGKPQSVHALRAERCSALFSAWLQRGPRWPIGKDFEDFVREFMFHKGNYTSGAREYTEWLAEDIEWNLGFDPRRVELAESGEVNSFPIAARFRERIVEGISIYDGKTLEYDSESSYGCPDEHPRTCPEHPGIQLRRIPTDRPSGLTPEDAKGGDGVYQCPIDGETYSYTGGHEVEFTGSAASQIPDGLNSEREDAGGTTSNATPYATARESFEPVEPAESSWNERRKRVRPFLASEEETPWGLNVKSEDKPEKNSTQSEKKSPMTDKSRSNGQTKKADLFGPVQQMTRHCPDHPGVALARVSDKIYQCSLDGQIYDFERGFTTEDGEEHRGGSVAQMTPDSPGYYQSPHPPHLFPGPAKKAALGDLLTKHATTVRKALDARGTETRFCNDIHDALAGDTEAAERVSEIISHIREGDGRPLGGVAQQIYEMMNIE